MIKLPFQHNKLLSSRHKVKAIAVFSALVLALVVWPLLAFTSQGRAHSHPLSLPIPAITVTTDTAKRVDWPKYITLSGPVAAWQEASVGSEVSGQRLVAVNVNVGDHVEKGDILAVFDTASLHAEEAELKASLTQARAHEKQALTDKDRAVHLKGSGALSEQQIASYIAQADSASAQVEESEARLHSKRLQIEHTNVTAPEEGSVSARNATLGAVKNAGEELFRLIVKDRLEWRGELAAEQFTSVRPGQHVDLILPDSSHTKAVVRSLSPSLDPTSRTATVYADIEDGSLAMAGMYMEGKIEIAHGSTVVIPSASVVSHDGRSYVFKINDKSDAPQVLMQEVSLGRTEGNATEITHNLNEGDVVVVEGAGFLNDRDTVRLAPQEKLQP